MDPFSILPRDVHSCVIEHLNGVDEIAYGHASAYTMRGWMHYIRTRDLSAFKTLCGLDQKHAMVEWLGARVDIQTLQSGWMQAVVSGSCKNAEILLKWVNPYMNKNRALVISIVEQSNANMLGVLLKSPRIKLRKRESDALWLCVKHDRVEHARLILNDTRYSRYWVEVAMLEAIASQKYDMIDIMAPYVPKLINSLFTGLAGYSNRPVEVFRAVIRHLEICELPYVIGLLRKSEHHHANDLATYASNRLKCHKKKQSLH